MSPLTLLEAASRALLTGGYPFAVVGGLASSIYRSEPRLTKDVDIALAFGSTEESKALALKVVTDLGLQPALGWIGMAGERLADPVALVIGRQHEQNIDSTLDILLPTLPWVAQAVSRAQHNLIDFGFAKLPTITPEDLIIAKTFALAVEPNRFKDLDDLVNIFGNDNTLDLIYLVEALKRLQLKLPAALAEFAPAALVRGK